MLQGLDIEKSPSKDHHNHFHIVLRTPMLQSIDPPIQNLLADSFAMGLIQDGTREAMQATVQALIAEVQPIFNLQQGEITMFIMDVPDVPPQYAPIVIAQADQSQLQAPVGSTKVDRTIGVCQLIENPPIPPLTAVNSFMPTGSAWSYMREIEKVKPELLTDEMFLSAKAILLQEAEHGELKATPSGSYRYYPKPDYLGIDHAAFLVEMGGYKVKVVYHFKVMGPGIGGTEGYDPYMQKENCPKGTQWRISTTNDANGNLFVTSVQYQSPITGISTADTATSLLGSLGVDTSGITLNIADLPGSAVGQTTGTNMTLDTNAAGHNWFIDPTPGSNEEFLPTSNPYEWVAKAGSAAEGKMDMLSVLLHEYGHALGIEHSADSHDYMATTLTPGVRRMPSAEELALMQQLIGQAKDGLASATPLPNPLPQGERGLPDAPNPFPTLPLGGGFGLAFLGRLRSSRFGSMSIAPDYSTLVTQYAVSANPTFTNLNTPAGWNTQGGVDITPSTSSGQSGMASATLNEVSTSQTRLSQVFTLNERDRYLSFKLSGNVLDNLTGAPDDAFEVALLDANTGASLLGNDGLTRTDAIINLQGDGTQRTANCVTCINNADGSRTYRVDLTDIAAGTVANLSFDLLGFGASNSHVTLSDIRVSGLPQLHDDAATLAEDNLLSFDPFAQADAQLRPLLASHIVAAPTHGALAVNADGTFSYTPDLNYFGADSFSYRLSDGPLDSNLAIVSLNVTPVNDAPVVADVQATAALAWKQIIFTAPAMLNSRA